MPWTQASLVHLKTLTLKVLSMEAESRRWLTCGTGHHCTVFTGPWWAWSWCRTHLGSSPLTIFLPRNGCTLSDTSERRREFVACGSGEFAVCSSAADSDCVNILCLFDTYGLSPPGISWGLFEPTDVCTTGHADSSHFEPDGVLHSSDFDLWWWRPAIGLVTGNGKARIISSVSVEQPLFSGRVSSGSKLSSLSQS